MRGFISGLLIGLATLVVGIVGLSLFSPATPLPDVSDQAPQSLSAAAQIGEQAGVSAAKADNDIIELPPGAPGGQTGGRDDLASLSTSDTNPGDKPNVGPATSDLEGPGSTPHAPGINVTRDPPVALPGPAGELNAPSQNNETTALAGGDTNPGKRPIVGAVAAALTDPATETQAPRLNSGDTAPAANLTASGGLTAPAEDSDPTALANPATPIVADISQTGPGIAGATSDQDLAPEIATYADTAPAIAVASAEPQAPQAPQADQKPDPSTRTAAVAVAQSGPASAPVPKVGQNAPSGPATPASPQIAAVPVAPAAPSSGLAEPTPDVDQSARVQPEPPVVRTQEPADTQIAVLPQAGTQADEIRPRIGQRVVPLTERKVVENAGDQASPDPEISAAADAQPKAGPPIKANSARFENPDNRPLMAIVLIDDNLSLGGEALADFPYPLSFAVDPTDPEAAAKMARHRAAGFEVVLLTDIAKQATAQDAEVTLAVWLNSLPDVVALLEGPGTGIQGNRDLADQVTAIVTEAGLGLIMQARGLNTSFKLAARDGVPAALVFRDFDGAGQKPVVMRRFLDQAAFRAGQQGGVIMLGRLRPETISALLVWGLQDRVSRVALAPVSAVLTRE